ncbi:hypothetical protein [Agarivorans litoreus]|uniref:hypothetical protein n=1 Tax=Agarivorans litoreus TaxID=1510455 RepID=UPI001C7D5AD4|nr:hypothetical protein [Agarivorans litoreus]
MSFIENENKKAWEEEDWADNIACALVLLQGEFTHQRLAAIIPRLRHLVRYDAQIWLELNTATNNTCSGNVRDEKGVARLESRFYPVGVTAGLIFNYLSQLNSQLQWDEVKSWQRIKRTLVSLGLNPLTTERLFYKQLREHYTFNYYGQLSATQIEQLLQPLQSAPLTHTNARWLQQNTISMTAIEAPTQHRSAVSGKLLSQASPKKGDKQALAELTLIHQLRAEHIGKHDGVVAACGYLINRRHKKLSSFATDRSHLKELLHDDFIDFSSTDIKDKLSRLARRLSEQKKITSARTYTLCKRAIEDLTEQSIDGVANQRLGNIINAGYINDVQWMHLFEALTKAQSSPMAALQTGVFIIIMNRLGLRTQEAVNLRIKDVAHHDELGIQVRASFDHSLKTQQATRELPTVLIPEAERHWVNALINLRVAQYGADSQQPLFDISLDSVIDDAGAQLRALTGNEHCSCYTFRHCAFSRLALILFASNALIKRYTGISTDEIKAIRLALTGSEDANATNAQQVFNRLAGHADYQVGLHHYRHFEHEQMTESLINIQPLVDIAKITDCSAISIGKMIGAHKRMHPSATSQQIQHGVQNRLLSQYAEHIKRGGRPKKFNRISSPPQIVLTLEMLHQSFGTVAIYSVCNRLQLAKISSAHTRLIAKLTRKGKPVFPVNQVGKLEPPVFKKDREMLAHIFRHISNTRSIEQLKTFVHAGLANTLYMTPTSIRRQLKALAGLFPSGVNIGLIFSPHNDGLPLKSWPKKYKQLGLVTSSVQDETCKYASKISITENGRRCVKVMQHVIFFGYLYLSAINALNNIKV